MKIKIINPNTSLGMTQKIYESALAVANSDTEIIALSPEMGPASIESYYDEALCAVGLLTEIHQGEKNHVDAYIIACFGDPALYAARELTRSPVIGIAEAAMRTASYISQGFTVVTTLTRTINMAWHLAERYGLKNQCNNVRACEISVAALEEANSNAYQMILEECKQALVEDRSDCIVLGCAGMSDLCERLSQDLNVTVIDGVTAAVKQAEMLHQLGLKTSKINDWAFPPAKKYTGILAPFGRSD